MEEKLKRAELFFTKYGKKEISGLSHLLHPEIKMITPFTQYEGKYQFLSASKRFTSLFIKLSVLMIVGKNQQVIVIYDLDCPPPYNFCKVAAILDFDENFIIKMHLIYDGRIFERNEHFLFR